MTSHRISTGTGSLEYPAEEAEESCDGKLHHFKKFNITRFAIPSDAMDPIELIREYIPLNTTSLAVAAEFYRETEIYIALLDTSLPNIKSLTISAAILTTPLLHNLPSSLRTFKFVVRGYIDPYPQPLGEYDHLPLLLQSLTISYVNTYLNNLPPGLRYLTIMRCDFLGAVDHLQELLVSLAINCMRFSFQQAVILANQAMPAPDPMGEISLDYFPESLRCLKLYGRINSAIDNLPSSLLKLFIYCVDFDQSVDHLPASLQVLKMKSDKFQQPLDHLPVSLKYLCLGMLLLLLLCCASAANFLLGKAFNRPLDHLPCNLESLIFNSTAFSHPLDNLPSGLKVLKFNKICIASISYLPPHLQWFQCPVDMLMSNVRFISVTQRRRIFCNLDSRSSVSLVASYQVSLLILLFFCLAYLLFFQDENVSWELSRDSYYFN